MNRCNLCYGDVRGECLRAGRCIFSNEGNDLRRRRLGIAMIAAMFVGIILAGLWA